MRWAVFAAALLLPATANAKTWDARLDLTDLRITIGAPDAKLCVVHPSALRGTGADCADVDLKIYGNDKLNELLAVLEIDENSLSVSVVGSPDAAPHGELTDAEARALQQNAIEAIKRFVPPNVQTNTVILPPTRVNGVQVLGARTEVTGPGVDNVQRTYFFVGKGGLSGVRFVYARVAEPTLQPAIDAMVQSVHVPVAPSVRARLGTSLLSLLAGAPLVVLAAAVASRKKRGDDP